MGPYMLLFVLRDSNGSLSVLIVRFASLWIPMGPFGS